jgi:Rrf2 family protein
MLSNASKYAIRAVLFLAEKSDVNNKFGAIEISEHLEIPLRFIAKLLQMLAKRNIISSNKGPKGGFFMTEENLNLKVCDILDVIEVKKVFDTCFLGLTECSDNNPCPVHEIVNDFKANIFQKFKHQSIKEFSNDIKTNGTYLTLKGITQ